VTSKIQEATAIRDHLVSLIRSDGYWEAVGGLPQLVWTRAGWIARLVCPVDLRDVDGAAAEIATAAPNVLTLSDHRKRLFHAEWTEGGPIRVVAFERGAWEGKLLTLPREA
jgi:hypothetical protein